MTHYTIDTRSPVPIYEQLKDRIRLLVLSGVLEDGAQLPAIRQLARDLTINPNTVARVYRELELEGLVRTQAGRGCFVISASPVDAGCRRREMLRLDVRGLAERARALGVGLDDVLQILREEWHE